MLLKEMTLQNFRSYGGLHKISFSTDPDKNVTVFMGDGGTGKTTLAQAFLWALYGKTDFQIDELINRSARDLLDLNEGKDVRVELHLTHGNDYYVLTRKQHVKRNSYSFSTSDTHFSIHKIENGNSKLLTETERFQLIKTMLPEQLSKFFFFDGERIKNMSEEINHGQSKEFADAVRGLVGLTAMMNAIQHMKPNSTASVIGKYNKLIDTSGNQKISQLSGEINKLESDLRERENRTSEIDNQIEYYTGKIDEINNRILTYSDAVKIQETHLKLTSELASKNQKYAELVKQILAFFNKETIYYTSRPLIFSALRELNQSDKIKAGIPEVHAKSIQYIFDTKKCICGCDVIPGNSSYDNLKALLEYLPPKSIGAFINQFIEMSNTNVKLSEKYFSAFKLYFSQLQNLKEEIEDLDGQLSDTDTKLTDVSSVSALKQEQSGYKSQLKQLNYEKPSVYEKIGALKRQISEKDSDKNKLILVDQNNQVNNKYLQYAKSVYEYIFNAYSKQEKFAREELQNNINSVFSEIYSESLILNVDDNYNIRIRIGDHIYNNDELERNTSQSYSVIFAFIAGIIKMAKKIGDEHKSPNDELSFFSEAQGYPLVMDAPLSAFDTTRIRNISTSLPRIAQQIIIFIKDTDGEVAERYLGDKVGEKYLLTIDSQQLNTSISRRV